MTPARARRVVALGGAVTALTAALGLWTFGGPEESRREARDARRLSQLDSITNLVGCHIGQGEAPPFAVAAISEGCLSSSAALDFVDPGTGEPYAIDYPAPNVVRVCAAFEDTGRLTGYVSPSFDRATGCLSLVLGAT